MATKPTRRVTVIPAGRLIELHVDGVGVTQARRGWWRRREPERMVRDLVRRVEGVDPESFDIGWVIQEP